MQSDPSPPTAREGRLGRAVLGPITGSGLVTALTGVTLLGLGVWWGYATLAGIGAALLAAVAFDVVLVVRAPQLTVTRSVEPAVVERNGECWATLRLGGPRPRIAPIVLTDLVAGSPQVIDLTGDEVRHRVPTQRRGLIAVGPLSVHRVGLFGLAVATGTQGAVDHVRVLPRLTPVHRLPRGRRRSAVGADESAEHGGTDLVGLHEYVPGDDLRRLHGPTSARTGRLMVRDDAEPATPHLTIVLDDTAGHYADHGNLGTDFEDAVEVAFALCSLAEDLQQPVHLATVSGAIDEAVTDRDHADRRHLRAALAEVTPTGTHAVEGRSGRAARGVRLARGLDTVAVISGALAPIEVLAGIAGRGTTGALLLVHPGHPTTTAVNTVTVLRGPRSADLAALWDRAVG